MEIKQNLAFSKLLNERLGANSEYLNPDIMQEILEASRNLSVRTIQREENQLSKQKAGRKKKKSKKKRSKNN